MDSATDRAPRSTQPGTGDSMASDLGNWRLTRRNRVSYTEIPNQTRPQDAADQG